MDLSHNIKVNESLCKQCGVTPHFSPGQILLKKILRKYKYCQKLSKKILRKGKYWQKLLKKILRKGNHWQNQFKKVFDRAADDK